MSPSTRPYARPPRASALRRLSRYVEIREHAGQIRYRFTFRPLRVRWNYGCVLLIVACITSTVCAAIIAIFSTLRGEIDTGAVSCLGTLLLGSLLILALILTFSLIRDGLAHLLLRSEIRLAGGWIQCVERLGWFAPGLIFPPRAAGSVEVVGKPLEGLFCSHLFKRQQANVASLRFYSTRGRHWYAARGYPAIVLRAVAEDLSRRLEASRGEGARQAESEPRRRPRPAPPRGSEPRRHPRPTVAAPPSPPTRRPSRATRPRAPDITFLDDPAPGSISPAKVTECQVCGSDMTDDLVICGQCKTPHHRGCWLYIGRCSTYACGSRRFRAVLPAAPPQPPRASGQQRTECQVCGHELTTDVVFCSRCRTPHHRECWEYTKLCSTFACGSRAFAPVASPGSAGSAPVREERRGRRQRRQRRRLRRWMEAVSHEHGWGRVNSVSRKDRHCRVRFEHRGLRCSFDGLRTREGLTFHLSARLDDIAHQARALRHEIPSSSAVRKVNSSPELRLECATEVRGPEQLGQFVADALGIVEAIVA